MNENKQAALLPVMQEKALAKLVKRLEAQVSDLEGSIAGYEKSITVAGAQETLDRLEKIWGEAPHGGISAEELARQNRIHYAKTYSIHKAKLVTKTRRLNAAREEVGNRNRQALFGTRSSIA
jgi:hypothetical protein